MHRTTRSIAGIGIFLAGCGADGDGIADFHLCNTEYQGFWDLKLLELQHYEPRVCPVIINSAGQSVFSGGTIYDYGFWDAAEVNLSLYNSESAFLTNRTEDFRKDPNAQFAYVTVGTGYPAATGTVWRDYANFVVEMFDFSEGNAEVTVTYQTPGPPQVSKGRDRPADAATRGLSPDR